MKTSNEKNLLARIEELEGRLAESEQLVDAIRAGEVDAFAVKLNNHSEVFTLQSGDYAYRLLIEEVGEGTVNLTEAGLIVYINTYFAKLMDLPYEKIIGSPIFDFIHEQSKKEFENLFAEAQSGKSKGEINLVINNKIIPVYISLTSLKPKLSAIGIIITDLTEKKKNEETILKYHKDLELKNRELEQRNAELASFTYIASHDLKEPLRKIQTFSSRILDKESEEFSDATRDNFNRITSAAKRMQTLITSLLNYTRVTTSESLYAPTDLNDVLDEVKTYLQENIAENNVKIESERLPSVQVIPDQFVQLFSNIISNAIKYKKPGEDPLIRITANIVSAGEIRADVTSPDKKYFEINFIDNGIGFEQQFSDKIFELFQRLHNRFEYEGTGVGLAICKKIMSNHNGYIMAKGEPGAGARFSIYLPG